MRTLRERVIHTLLFEVLAIAIVTPTVAVLTGAKIGDAGTLSLLVSAGAMTANYLWTMVFDYFVPTRRRGFLLRAAQAVGLELIIASFTIPLVIWLTGVTFWKAVVLDLGGVAFFIVFSMTYNAIFDAVMTRILARPARFPS